MFLRPYQREIGALMVLAILIAPSYAVGAIQFQNVTANAGPFRADETYGASWGDFNKDGWPDLYVGYHRERSAVYRNNGTGTFTDWTLQIDGSRTWRGLIHGDDHGAAWADFDNDGDQDLMVSTGFTCGTGTCPASGWSRWVASRTSW